MSIRTVQLGNVCEVLMGQSPPSSTYNSAGTGLPFFQGKVDFGDTFPVTRVYCDAPTRTADPGDILISVRAPVGPTNMARERCCIGRGLSALRPEPNLNASFLLYFLRYHEPVLAQKGLGSTFAAINRDDLAETTLPLPDLPEQKRIAGILEQADRLRRTRRYALELSDTLLPAAFLALFGDPAKGPKCPLVPFGELIKSGPQNGLYKPASAYGSGTRIVRIDAYQNGEAIDFSELKRVRLSADEIATYGLNECDFLINRVNSRSHLGKSTVVPRLSEPAVFESNMMRFRVDEQRLNPVYVARFLQTPFLNAQIQKQAKDASNQSSINQDDVEGFAILLPPAGQQRHFAALVERHEHLRSKQREALRQAEHLFQSLLNRAFKEGL